MTIDGSLHDGIWFNNRFVPEPENAYVCWVDVMGTGQELRRRSLRVGANFVMKLQMAVISARDALLSPDQLTLYPMIDGVYGVTTDRRNAVEWLNRTFGSLAEHFLRPDQRPFRFIVRGGVAFGPIVQGKDIVGGSRILSDNLSLRSRVLIGPPLAQAYDAERNAPPYGIVIHESAVNSCPPGEIPLGGPFLKWWGDGDAQRTSYAQKLRPELIAELRNRAALTGVTGYPEKSLASHIALIEEYLPSQPELPW